jgi:hypothetical protein
MLKRGRAALTSVPWLRLLPVVLALTKSPFPLEPLVSHIAHAAVAWCLSTLGASLAKGKVSLAFLSLSITLSISLCLFSDSWRLVLCWSLTSCVVPAIRSLSSAWRFPEVLILSASIASGCALDGIRETWLATALFSLVPSTQALVRNALGRWTKSGSLASKCVWFASLAPCIMLLQGLYLMYAEHELVEMMIKNPKTPTSKQLWQEVGTLERWLGLRKDPAAVLGTRADASVREVRRAYRRAMLHAHPDKAPRGTGPLAQYRQNQQQRRLEDIQWAMKMLTEENTSETLSNRLESLHNKLMMIFFLVAAWTTISFLAYVRDCWIAVRARTKKQSANAEEGKRARRQEYHKGASTSTLSQSSAPTANASCASAASAPVEAQTCDRVEQQQQQRLDGGSKAGSSGASHAMSATTNPQMATTHT